MVLLMSPLFLACVGLFGAGIYAALFCYRGPSLAKTVVKSVPLGMFTLAGVIGGANPWIVMGLFLSLLGDVALSRPHRAAFLYGLCAFALAHFVYLLWFMQLAPAPIWGAFVEKPVLALVALAVAFSTELWLSAHTGALRWAVRIYVLLITLMVLAALAVPHAVLLAIGVVLFFLSDTILAWQTFRMADGSRLDVPASVVLWVFYVLAQLLILMTTG